MGNKLLGVMTGVALLASIGVASAGQRVTLTDAQLDGVVAGDASVSAIAHEGNASVIFFLNDTATFSAAGIAANFTPNSGSDSTIALTAAASVP